MIGAKQQVYGAAQFASGLASSDYAGDAALSLTSSQTNPFVTPGLIRGTKLVADTSTNLVDNIIATSEDGTGGLKARLAVGDAANYYTIDTSGNITKVATGADTSNYTYGRTDVAIQSGGSGNYYAFVSHGTNLSLWNGSTTISESWWTTVAYLVGTTTRPNSLTSTPHPLLNFNTNLWVADGSQLHNIIPNVATTSNSAAVNQSVLSLDLYSTIYALGIDPTTGLMMISFQTTQNQSDTISSQFYIGLYDGYSTGLRRKIPVDDLVTGFKNVGGVVYCTFGPKVGYWNGNGITFLRNLINVTNSSTSLISGQRMSNVGNVLLVADGPTLLAYGEPMAGKPKAWFNLGYTIGLVDRITAVCPLGSNKIGIFNFYTVGSIYNFRTYDLSSLTGTSFNLVLAYTYFQRPVYIRKMRVITTGIARTGLTDITSTITDEKGAALPISNANRIVSVPTGTTYVVDFDYGGAKCQGIAPFISGTNGSWAVVQIIIYYDIAE